VVRLQMGIVSADLAGNGDVFYFVICHDGQHASKFYRK
jgi:hypothetical protein